MQQPERKDVKENKIIAHSKQRLNISDSFWFSQDSLACSLPAAPAEGSGASLISTAKASISILHYQVLMENIGHTKVFICCVDDEQQKSNWPEARRCVCDFWLRFSPDGALCKVFHEPQHFCNLGGNINRWWELEQLERFLCQGVCLGIVLVPRTQTKLQSSDKPQAAFCPPPRDSVYYLPAESAKSENNQASRKYDANRKTVSDQQDETWPPGGASHSVQVFGWRKGSCAMQTIGM